MVYTQKPYWLYCIHKCLACYFLEPIFGSFVEIFKKIEKSTFCLFSKHKFLDQLNFQFWYTSISNDSIFKTHNIIKIFKVSIQQLTKSKNTFFINWTFDILKSSKPWIDFFENLNFYFLWIELLSLQKNSKNDILLCSNFVISHQLLR